MAVHCTHTKEYRGHTISPLWNILGELSWFLCWGLNLIGDPLRLETPGLCHTQHCRQKQVKEPQQYIMLIATVQKEEKVREGDLHMILEERCSQYVSPCILILRRLIKIWMRLGKLFHLLSISSRRNSFFFFVLVAGAVIKETCDEKTFYMSVYLPFC